MLLESSYDRAFIDEELAALQDFFEICDEKILNEKIADKEAHLSTEAICVRHQWLVEADMDSIVELLSEYFFQPLKSFLPARFHLGVMLWTQIDDREKMLLSLYFKLVAQAEIDAFVKHIDINPDSRVSVLSDKTFGTWLVIIRNEKPNTHEKKLLE